MKKTKIAFILRTIGLEYDDRIRKECIALSKTADIKIYAHFYDNRREEGITSYGIPYKSVELTSRKLLKPSKGLLFKALEFYFRVRSELADYDIIWAHEEYTFLFPLFLKKNHFIWDLHEIPSKFDSPRMRPFFHYIERTSKRIIHANKYRINYLIDNGTISLPDKHVFVPNLPDTEFVNADQKKNIDHDFHNWLGKDKYVYLQGLAVSIRHPSNTIECILKTPNIKAVVIGSVDKDALKYLNNKYSDKLSKKVYFTGMIDQLAIPYYLRGAVFSIILYDLSTPNNEFCEPNRLYQTIALGVPVITGCNEPMKATISKYQCGISLKTDGGDLKELETTIVKILDNHQFYKLNAKNAAPKMMWDNKLVCEDWYK